MRGLQPGGQELEDPVEMQGGRVLKASQKGEHREVFPDPVTHLKCEETSPGLRTASECKPSHEGLGALAPHLGLPARFLGVV